MLLSLYYIYQLVEAAKDNSSYGIGSSIIVICILLILGIIGLIAGVRRSKSITISFIATCVLVAIVCIAELIITAVYAENDEKCSDDMGAIADYVCGMGGELKLIIPLAVGAFVSIVGAVSGAAFVITFNDDGNTDSSGKELENYYA